MDGNTTKKDRQKKELETLDRLLDKQIAFQNEDYLISLRREITILSKYHHRCLLSNPVVAEYLHKEIIKLKLVFGEVEKYAGSNTYTIRDYERDHPEDSPKGKNARVSIADASDFKRKNVGTASGLDRAWSKDESGEDSPSPTDGDGLCRPESESMVHKSGDE